MLRFHNVSYGYQKDDLILDTINIQLPNCGLILITGPSGSGKTTFLSLIQGIIKPQKGDIIFNGRVINRMSVKENQDYRLFTCSMVYQSDALINDLSIEQNFNLFRECTTKETPNYQALIDQVHLPKSLQTKVGLLSGGEKQRVAIARSLLFAPQIFLLDEPTSSLDDQNACQIMDLLKELSKRCLIIMVTHDMRFIDKYADYHYELKEGKLVLTYQNTSTIVERKLVPSVVYHRKNPHRFLLTYVFNKIKIKRGRTLFSVFFLMITILFGLMSVTIIESMEKELLTSFSSLTEKAQFQMYVTNDNEEDNRYSVSLDYAQELRKNVTEIEDIMTFYEDDLSLFFPDRNECRLLVEGKPLLPGIRMQEINEFHLLKEKEHECYPYLHSLADDEIVLGLPSDVMKRIGQYLDIPFPTYEKIGKRLQNDNISIVFYMKNIDWDYENEEIFRICGIVESTKPSIFHSNPFFNECVLEERLRLLSTLSWFEEIEFPWTLRKRYVALCQQNLESIIFNHPIYYTCLVDEINKSYTEWRHYALSYNNISYIASYDVLRILNQEEYITGALYGSSKGYQIINETIVQGMPGYFFLSDDLEQLNDVEYNIMHESHYSLPETIFSNSILTPSNNTLRICANKNKPELFGISKALADYYHLQEKDTLYYLYVDLNAQPEFIYGTEQVDYIDFTRTEELYVDNQWLNSLFLQAKSITSSYLRPMTINFYVDDVNHVDHVIDHCRQLYNNYTFSDAVSIFQNRIQKTTSSIEKVMLGIIVWMMVLTSFLIRVVHRLYLMEMDHDIRWMVKLGIGSSIPKKVAFIAHLLIFGGATILALIYFGFIVMIFKIPRFLALLPFGIVINGQTIGSLILFLSILYGVTFPFYFKKVRT